MDDEELARLLSGKNRPSVLAREREAHRAIAEARRPRRGLLYGVGAVAAAAAVLVVVLRPSEPEVELVARGGDAPTLVLSCGAAETPCTPGATLGFEARPAQSFRFLAAFARREDGVFLWYVPEPDGQSVALDAARPKLDTAIKLGPDHPPGEHLVYGVFSTRPLSRDEIIGTLGDDLQGSSDVRVVVKQLRVAVAR